MIIDCISDLHGFFPELSGGDLLIIAGDITNDDKIQSWAKFFAWLKKQNYKKKIIVGGNHDNFLEISMPHNENTAKLLAELQSYLVKNYDEEPSDYDYLCNSGTEFEGLKIWGSPHTQYFEDCNKKCTAFMVEEDIFLEEKFKLIPNNTDILITHCPPYGILDSIIPLKKNENPYKGSKSLLNHCMQRIKPILHVYGHIHEHGGKLLDGRKTKFINASIMNEHYKPLNKPVRIIL